MIEIVNGKAAGYKNDRAVIKVTHSFTDNQFIEIVKAAVAALGEFKVMEVVYSAANSSILTAGQRAFIEHVRATGKIPTLTGSPIQGMTIHSIQKGSVVEAVREAAIDRKYVFMASGDDGIELFDSANKNACIGDAERYSMKHGSDTRVFMEVARVTATPNIVGYKATTVEL